MRVDPSTLPVPQEFDLRCPRCDYPLRGLTEHVCPECGGRFDPSALVRPWSRLRRPRFTGGELPLPDFGLSCGGCGEALAGATRRACPACGEPFDLEAMRPKEAFVPLDPRHLGRLPAAIVEMLLAEEQIPHIAHEGKTAVDHYAGTQAAGPRALGVRLMIASEFFFEVLELLARTRSEIAAQRGRADSGWTCGACGEESPGNFETCWNCGGERPAAA